VRHTSTQQITKLEGQVGEATAAGKAAAMEEARSALQPLIEQLRRDKAEAMELYSQENRKRKLVHNKLLELQGNIRVRGCFCFVWDDGGGGGLWL
jgi:hypothetical protein